MTPTDSSHICQRFNISKVNDFQHSRLLFYHSRGPPKEISIFQLMINGLRKTFKSHSFPKTFFQGLVRFSSQTLDCPCCNAQALFGLNFFPPFFNSFWSHSNAMLTSKILPGFITLIYKKNEAQPTLLFKMSTTSRGAFFKKISKCKNDIVS